MLICIFVFVFVDFPILSIIGAVTSGATSAANSVGSTGRETTLQGAVGSGGCIVVLSRTVRCSSVQISAAQCSSVQCGAV